MASVPVKRLEINRDYLNRISSWSGRERLSLGRGLVRRLVYGRPTRLTLFPLLLGAAVWVLNRARAGTPRGLEAGQLSPLYVRALTYIDQFAEQYPLLPYPIIAKALELAYVKELISERVESNSRVVELAI